jgi:UDP-hydrolysing UDP-N-acetyl-D-glucosamine 2-epimerase
LALRADVELQIVVAASALADRTGRVSEVMKRDGFTVSEEVSSLVEGDTALQMVQTTGLGLIEIGSVFKRMNPDLVVTIADRYETIATAIAASYLRIPLAHIQGGEVTGNIDEKVRHAITKLADLHLVSTSKSMQNVIAMGEDPRRVYLTECPSIDIAKNIEHRKPLDFSPFEKYGGVGEQIDLSREYIVVMQHPVTSEIELARAQAANTLKVIGQMNIPTMWFWPNVDAGADGTSKEIRRFRELNETSDIHFFKNMSPEDFLTLINNCSALVGNSSVGIRESSYLGVPVVNIGTRQSGREFAGNVIHCGYGINELEAAIRYQVKQGRYQSSQLYGSGNAGILISEVLATAELTTDKKLKFQ